MRGSRLVVHIQISEDAVKDLIQLVTDLKTEKSRAGWAVEEDDSQEDLLEGRWEGLSGRRF